MARKEVKIGDTAYAVYVSFDELFKDDAKAAEEGLDIALQVQCEAILISSDMALEKLEVMPESEARNALISLCRQYAQEGLDIVLWG